MDMLSLWILVAVALTVVEAAVVSLVIFPFAVGALAAAAAAALGAGLELQLALFALAGIPSYAFVRPYLASRLHRHPQALTGVQRLPGAEGVAVHAVSEHAGLVKVDGEEWTARVDDLTPPIAAGEQVRVRKVAGATLLVESIER